MDHPYPQNGSDPLPPPPAEPDLIRPFVITGGRTKSGRVDLRVETMVQQATPSGAVTLPEQDALLSACADGPTSIAELSAATGLPLGVATVLVGDLIDDGSLTMHQTDPEDIEVSALTRMIERVRAL